MAGSPNHNRDELAATLDLILQNQQTFQTNLSTITTELQQLKASLVELQQFPSEICPNDHDSSATTMKLDNIPRFDGSDPLGWIFKITQFFDVHLTPEDQRLPIASFYMQEGEALTWFQRMHSNGQLLSWPSFLHALEIRFAAPPPPSDDTKGALFKLCQTSSVKEYQAEFETLANRIVGLPPPFYLTCFISGLKSEIRTQVQAISLSQAINLAKLQEQKLNIDRPRHPTVTPHTKPTEAEATTSATSPTNNTNHAGFNICNWCG